MDGNIWMFSDQIDDEYLEFMTHEFITYNRACHYYRLGLKVVTRLSHECGSVYKIGKKVVIRRSIFEAYQPEGKQSMKDLMKQNSKLANIEVTDHNIRDFERVAKKYNTDFALKKDKLSEKPRYTEIFENYLEAFRE